MSTIAIHGFGRIGRTLLRAAVQHQVFTPGAISDIRDAAALAALFAVDTNYGRWPEPVEADGPGIRIGARSIPYFNTQTVLRPWGDLGIDLVVDCTGRDRPVGGSSSSGPRGEAGVG